ncbi:LAMI_0D03510g1_1 [Lachancea mirantina]|uniref:LAMI_0D03510g1_1 n=1 Tax=Lachancea mirantina TaxID=1230905 RepID=A0A1G4J9V6_9SACH|nr:LAMI_0D03510g1_1 [Lachancea mirantina]
MPTNTIIITSDAIEVAETQYVTKIQRFLSDTTLKRHNVAAPNAIQILPLRGLQRVVIVFPDVKMSCEFMDAVRDTDCGEDVRLNFSMLNTDATHSESKYLKLPPHEKLFLVSPPASPPPEFDYSRLEDPPVRSWPENRQSRDVCENSIDSNSPARVLLQHPAGTIVIDQHQEFSRDTLQDDDVPFQSVASFKTGMPPKSTFDTSSDED